MQSHSIKKVLFLMTVLATSFTSEAIMAYPEFICAYERDNNPPLKPEAEVLFQKARALEKNPGIKDWKKITHLYEQAIEMDHWKALHNMAGLYRTGWPGLPGIEKDTGKMLGLYKRMVDLRVPLGYYNWAVVAEHGNGLLRSDRMAASYMFQAAQLGHPLAQVTIGRYFAYSLPRAEQDDAMAEQYYRCAGAQENTAALLKVASFYKIAKRNMPRALAYYQKAASLGEFIGFSNIIGAFEEPVNTSCNYGYAPDKELKTAYEQLLKQSDKDPNLKFPNLAKNYPLPRHPKQGYDAEHPDQRPEL